MKYTPEQYAKTLYEILSDSPEDEHQRRIREFVLTLKRNNDMPLWNQVSTEFERHYYQNQRKEKIELTVPTEEEGERVSHMLNEKSDVETKIDKTLLGGARVKIGDRMIDNTIKSRIEKLKSALLK